MWDELSPESKRLLSIRQTEREEDQLDAGARRYWENNKRQGGVGRAEEDLMRGLFAFHIKRLSKLQRKLQSISPRRRVDPTIRAFLATAPVEELAGVSLLVPLLGMMESGRGQDVSSVVQAIGSAVRRTLVVQHAKAEWETRTENLKHVCAQWTYDQSRRWLKSVELNPERWPHELTYRLGTYLLREMLVSNALYSVTKRADMRRILQLSTTRNHNGMRQVGTIYAQDIQARGIFELGMRYENGKTHAQVTLTERAFEGVINGHLGNQDMRPAYGPMVMPPRDWNTDHDGGYNMLRNNLVKPVKMNGNVEAGTTPAVRDAVNVVQRTTWAVDLDVLAVMDEVWDRGGDRCGLPSRERPEMPAKVTGGDHAAIKANKLARKLAWDDWYNEQSARLSVAKTLREGYDLANLPIWFVWTMDFRGRMYPLADCLSPQGADYQKAPLVFAKAVHISSNEGLDWLCINMANLYGEDKCSLDDRVKWVEDNEHKILKAAGDPLQYIDWWGSADKPWCFLAAILDYRRWKNTGKSRMPVAMDGSCNGIQHLSALGRDQRGAKATNLLACEIPNDIYMEVADELLPLIQGSDNEFRQLFPKDRVTRKLCKRATMTTPYGVTRQGVRTQFISDGHLKHLPVEMQSQISTWLTDLTTEAIGNVVKSARQVMDWLQYLAKEHNRRGLAMQWTTPDGKLVTQEYLKKKEYTVRVPGMGQITFHLADEGLGINKNNQRNGAAPNFVHSLDGCHERETARSMQFVTVDLGMVHDSFACHAEHAPFMAYVIRQEFIRMHKLPLLEQLHEQITQQLDCYISPPPIVGDLNVSLVSGARYFFA